MKTQKKQFHQRCNPRNPYMALLNPHMVQREEKEEESLKECVVVILSITCLEVV
jgi:hypothetical protein